ncbi:hypothetical protein P5753_30360, partial [Bacillus cereus]|nr:hypothetical protein [Bacillus cereus]
MITKRLLYNKTVQSFCSPQSLATFSRRSTDDELGVEEFISTFRYCQLNTANIEDYQDLLR